MFQYKVPGTDLLLQAIVPTTIGAERLNGRVRDGNGCGPLANDTGNSIFKLSVCGARDAQSRPAYAELGGTGACPP